MNRGLGAGSISDFGSSDELLCIRIQVAGSIDACDLFFAKAGEPSPQSCTVSIYFVVEGGRSSPCEEKRIYGMQEMR